MGLYPAPSPGVFLKILETPTVFKRSTDELYTLDEGGLAALRRCDGVHTLEEAALDPEFLEFCLEEGVLELLETPTHRPPPLDGPSPTPSLRYLELQITRRCNLACSHCYLGDPRPLDLAPEPFRAAVEEFAQMGGLRLMISGGEPLTHPRLPELLEFLRPLPLRRILLTNGHLLAGSGVTTEHFDEVQVSLDGMRRGHELMRGEGSFARALSGARWAAENGFDLSVATQAHAGNLEEFEELGELARTLGAREWSIDAPCVAGRLAENHALAVTPKQAAIAMAHGFGASYHGGSEGAACGYHLMTVGADGLAAQCGFYFDNPLGTLSEGLAECWSRRKPTMLSEIEGCSACEAASDCGGGCRFRAESRERPDKVMCAAFGVLPPA